MILTDPEETTTVIPHAFSVEGAYTGVGDFRVFDSRTHGVGAGGTTDGDGYSLEFGFIWGIPPHSDPFGFGV